MGYEVGCHVGHDVGCHVFCWLRKYSNFALGDVCGTWSGMSYRTFMQIKTYKIKTYVNILIHVGL